MHRAVISACFVTSASSLMSPVRTRLLLASNFVDPSTFWRCLDTQRHSFVESSHAKTPVTLLYVPTASLWLDPDSTSTRSLGKRRQRARASLKKNMQAVVASLSDRSDSDATSGSVDSKAPSSSPPDNRGIEAQWLDVGDPAVNAAAVKDAVTRADCVYVEGGNTFWLAHHMRRTGFRDALQAACSTNVLPDGRKGVFQGKDPLYIGISAGAIVAGKSIAPALWKGSVRYCSYACSYCQ